MRLPWSKQKPVLDRDITLRIGTLLNVMDATRIHELDQLQKYIDQRRETIAEVGEKVEGL